MAGEGVLELEQLKDGGFSDEQRRQYVDDTRAQLMDGGFTPGQADEYFGVRPYNPVPAQKLLENNLSDFTSRLRADSEKPKDTPLEMPASVREQRATTFEDGIRAGWQLGNIGQIARGGAPPRQQVDDISDWYVRMAQTLGMTAGDAATMAATGLAAGAAGLATGPGAPIMSTAMAAGAMNAAPTALRAMMTDAYNNGEVVDFKDFWTRSSKVMWETAKAFTVGAATLGVGKKVGLSLPATMAPVARVGTELASEIGTMVTVGKALEGHVPSKQDFLDGAIVIAGLHGAGAVSQKLMQVWKATGVSPAEVAERSTTDTVLRQEMMAKGDEIPAQYREKVDPAFARERQVTDVEGNPVNGGKQGIFTGKNGQQYVLDVVTQKEGLYEIKATDLEGKYVGIVSFDNFEDKKSADEGFWHPDGLNVVAEHQRQGVATAMYDFAREKLGIEVQPEAMQNVRSPEGAAFRKAYGEGGKTDLSSLDTAAGTLKKFLAGETGSASIPKAKPEIVRSEAELKTLARIGSVKKPSVLERAKNFFSLKTWNEVYRKAFDKYDPFKEFEKAAIKTKEVDGVKTPADIPADESPYKRLRLSKGNAGRAKHFIDIAPFDPITLENVKVIRDGVEKDALPLRAIYEPFADDLDSARSYLINKRDVEKLGQGVQTGGDLETAKAGIKAVEERYGKEAMRTLSKEATAFSDHTSDYLVKTGVLAKEAAADFKKTNKNYIPFFRVFEDTESGASPGKGLTVFDPIKKMLGSDLKQVDPIEAQIKNTHLYIELGERNMVLNALVDMAAKHGMGEDILKEVPATIREYEVTSSEMAALTESFGQDAKIVEQSLSIFRSVRQPLAENQFQMRRDGKLKVYEAHPELIKVIKDMDAQSAGVFTKILSGFTKTLKAGTVILPEFMFKNLTRDQLTAAINSKHGYMPLLDFALGMKEIVGEGEAYSQWLKGGGFAAAWVSGDRDFINEHVMRLDPMKNALENVRNSITSPKRGAQALGELMENATRLGEMRKAMEGKDASAANIMEGALDAREVTVDFQRMGAKMQGFNQAIAFLNPQVQGVERAARAFKEDPMGYAIRSAAYITLPSVLFWWAHKDDPRQQQVPRWQRWLHWIVQTDDWKPATAGEAKLAGPDFTKQVDGQWYMNHGTPWRIPKPHIEGILFGSLLENVLDHYYRKDPGAFKGLGDALGTALLPGVIPTMLGPAFEQYANRSTFVDAPIIPGYLEGTLPDVQYAPYTSDTARALGKLVWNIPFVGDKKLGGQYFASPMIIENYIRAWSGGLGMYALQISDAALHAAGIAPAKPKADNTWADTPFFKAFAVRFPGGNAQSVIDFGDRYRNSQEYEKSFHVEKSRGNYDDAFKLRLAEENQSKFVRLRGADNAIQRLKKVIENVDRDPKMDPTQKRQIMDGYYFGMITIAKQANTWMDDIEAQFAKAPKKGTTVNLGNIPAPSP